MCYCTTLTTTGSVPAHFSDVPGGVLVPVKDETTIGTGVSTTRQSLRDVLPASGTVLACIAWTDFHDLFCGAFSLLLQNKEELSPAGIGDRSGERMVLEHSPDVQALDIEDVKLTNEIASGLVMKVQSRSLNSLMGFG